MKKTFILITTLLIGIASLNAQSETDLSKISPFNDNLTEEDKTVLTSGDVLIKNIKFDSNMCLNSGFTPLADTLLKEIEELNPKYLAEIIQFKKYEGNEDLPERLVALLNNVPEYAGIPYYSERHECYFDLYESAVIKETKATENGTEMYADLVMAPFGTVEEKINIYQSDNAVLYTSVNLNKLRYHDQFDCVKPERMKMCILLIRDGENWILYGIGGVNAPRIPFFTSRIETSFMNRIKTFCDFIFKKF